jgi:KDO2-lipid IV(A) lauroyltransferase
LRLVIILIENLPIRTSYFLGHCLGMLIYLIARRERCQIYANLEIVYQQGIPFPKKKFARSVFISFSLAFIELILANRFVRKENWKNFFSGQGVELFEKELPLQQKGGVITTGHLGSFLMAGLIPAYTGYPVTTVIQPWDSPKLTEVYAKMLTRLGQKPIIKKEAYEVCQKTVANKEYVILVCDQHGGRKSLYLDFFGKKAYHVAGPAALCRQFQVPIYVGGMMRVGMFRFVLHLEKVEPVLTEDKQVDLENITKTMHGHLEKWILQYPEQWFWMHRRWR